VSIEPEPAPEAEILVEEPEPVLEERIRAFCKE